MNDALAPTRNRKSHVKQNHSSCWTKEEDRLLTHFVQSSPNVSWSVIAKFFKNKSPSQLAGRWEKVLNPDIVKGSWTRAEDEIIRNFVNENGDKDWAKLALLLPGRTGKQCRERFKNHLDSSVSNTPWTRDDDEKLIRLHALYGNSWTMIAKNFSGKTDNAVKNRWNSTLKKRLERLEKGQPIVLKRGRKPKVQEPPESRAIEQSIEPPLSSSPIKSSQPASYSIKPPLFELSLFGAFGLSNRNNEKSSLPGIRSVDENRLNLQRMLNELA